MAVTAKPPLPLPPDVPIVDVKTGLPSKQFVDWLAKVNAYLETLRAGIP